MTVKSQMKHLAYAAVARWASGFYAMLARLVTLFLTLGAYFRLLDRLYPYPKEPPDWFVLVGLAWLCASAFLSLLVVSVVMYIREGSD